MGDGKTGPEFRTPQEDFWAGEFGDEYTDRNQGEQISASNLSLFAEILGHTGSLSSVCELGANIGLNLAAIQRLMPQIDVTAVEINKKAVEQLRNVCGTVIESSILDVKLEPGSFDMVFTKGVLIHINPDHLRDVYSMMAQATRRYVLVCEYYNPVPTVVTYRNHEDRLFKRDYAGEFLDSNPAFEICSYGFRYHRGAFPADDFTWFLMERSPVG